MAKAPESKSVEQTALPQQNIDRVLQEAANRGRTPEEKFEQRVSWAFGQYPDGAMSKEEVRELLKES